MNTCTQLKRLIFIFLTLSLLVACGQKGDLYLPESSNLISWIG